MVRLPCDRAEPFHTAAATDVDDAGRSGRRAARLVAGMAREHPRRGFRPAYYDARAEGFNVNHNFQFDATTDGRPIKIVSIVDAHIRECLGGLVELQIRMSPFLTRPISVCEATIRAVPLASPRLIGIPE